MIFVCGEKFCDRDKNQKTGGLNANVQFENLETPAAVEITMYHYLEGQFKVGFHFCNWDDYRSIYGFVKNDVEINQNANIFGYKNYILIGMDEETKQILKLEIDVIEKIKNVWDEIEEVKFTSDVNYICLENSNVDEIHQNKKRKQFGQMCSVRRNLVKLLTRKMDNGCEINFLLPHPFQSDVTLSVDNEHPIKISSENYTFNIYPIYIFKYNENGLVSTLESDDVDKIKDLISWGKQ